MKSSMPKSEIISDIFKKVKEQVGKIVKMRKKSLKSSGLLLIF